MLGGVTTALALWSATGLLRPIPYVGRTAILLAFAGACLLKDLHLLEFSLPQNRRLIPREVLVKDPRFGPLQFGFELGTGVRTYVPLSSPYVAAVAILLLGPNLAASMLVGLGFAGGRALMPVVRVLSDSGNRWDESLNRSKTTLAAATSLTATLLAAWLVWA